MISVTRLNGKKFWINPHLIETMEETPDTVVTLLSGKKIVLKETVLEVKEEIFSYRKKLGEGGREYVPTLNRGE